MRIDWSDKVVRDFRQRILVDSNSPILAFKANRDRFCQTRRQEKYAGMPHLGAMNSEDALTWNVFRSLQKARRLNVVIDWLRIDIGTPSAVLIWCLAPELTDAARELQFKLGDLLRSSDGIIPGQIGEPDVVVQGTDGIAIIECKLGEPNKALTHLWKGSSPERIKKRLSRYRQDVPELLRSGKTEADVEPVYQLVRMAYYAIRLGRACNLRPTLVSIGNQCNWHKEIRGLGKCPDEVWDTLPDLLGSVQLNCINTTWQALLRVIEKEGRDCLYQYLAEHPCLKCSSE